MSQKQVTTTLSSFSFILVIIAVIIVRQIDGSDADSSPPENDHYALVFSPDGVTSIEKAFDDGKVVTVTNDLSTCLKYRDKMNELLSSFPKKSECGDIQKQWDMLPADQRAAAQHSIDTLSSADLLLSMATVIGNAANSENPYRQ